MLDAIVAAQNWLLHSGIQNPDGEHKGAFNSWYDNTKKAYEYAYSEITGYGISTLLFYYTLTQERIFLDRAESAASWLMHKARHASGGVLTRYFYNKETTFMGSFENEEIFSFDCGMVLNGMTSLYEITKKKEYLTFCTRLANFLLTTMQKPDGSFYAVYDAKNNTLIDDGEKWSTQSGCLHAKCAIGLIKLTEATRDETYKNAAKKVCDYSLRYQQADGRFVTFKKTGDTLFHPHCYAAEGFYVAGNAFHNNTYLDAARKATSYLFTHQLPNGGIPSFYKKNSLITFERTDILAQALRMGAIYAQDVGKEKLQKLATRLCEFQEKKNAQKGGFTYGYDDTGKQYDHANSWCTMFALQALTLLTEEKALPAINKLLV